MKLLWRKHLLAQHEHQVFSSPNKELLFRTTDVVTKIALLHEYYTVFRHFQRTCENCGQLYGRRKYSHHHVWIATIRLLILLQHLFRIHPCRMQKENLSDILNSTERHGKLGMNNCNFFRSHGQGTKIKIWCNCLMHRDPYEAGSLYTVLRCFSIVANYFLPAPQNEDVATQRQLATSFSYDNRDCKVKEMQVYCGSPFVNKQTRLFMQV